MFTKKEAWALVGGLSNPSKMPGYGYGLSAKDCITGSKLRKIANSVCAGCYALKGRYVFPNVYQAHQNRLKSIQDKLWVEAMAFLINWHKKKTQFFRWHDSGDLQSVSHLKKIVDVCNKTKDISHWLPTREVGIVKDYKKKYGEFPFNLVVRISATMINGIPHKFHKHSSTVVTDQQFAENHLCQAYKQDNECKDCRACWEPRISDISYLKH
jgi:hypothetical protein